MNIISSAKTIPVLLLKWFLFLLTFGSSTPVLSPFSIPSWKKSQSSISLPLFEYLPCFLRETRHISKALPPSIPFLVNREIQRGKKGSPLSLPLSFLTKVKKAWRMTRWGFAFFVLSILCEFFSTASCSRIETYLVFQRDFKMTLAFSINSKNQVSKAIIFNAMTLITERKLWGIGRKKASERERRSKERK